MNTRSIILRAHEVRGILSGRQTQVRRVVKPRLEGHDGFMDCGKFGPVHLDDLYPEVLPELIARCPFGAPGGRLWVRESVYIDYIPYDAGRLPKERPHDEVFKSIYYRADGDCCEQIPECCCAEVGKPRWRAAGALPKWASRLTLEITDVRVQRLQDIGHADAAAEGWPGDAEARALCEHAPGLADDAAIEWYADLWESLYGPGSWSANSWLWALTFRRIESPAHREGT